MINKNSFLFFFYLLFCAGVVSAQRSTSEGWTGEVAPAVANEKPADLEGVGIKEHLGETLDLSLMFTNEQGVKVPLSSFFTDGKPVIISPVYYSCPSLCNFHLNGLTDALKEMDWSVGQQFKVVAVSFDAKETYEVAAKKKTSYMAAYARPGTENGWSFLTGEQAAIDALMKAVGFSYKWNESEGEWAHASAAIMISPEGKITRYLPGIMFAAKDVKLAITEAGKGKVGSFVDQLVLYCFQYNPHQSKYTLYSFNIMKLGGAVMILILLIWMIPHWLRSRRGQEARNI